MIALTVSTNYTDFLKVCIEHNSHFFKEWFIITSQKDTATIECAKEKSNITLMYYDFQNNQNIFDKGGAIREMQYAVRNKYGMNQKCLIIDSDIVLPKNFLEILEFKIQEDCIYSAIRYDYYSINDFMNKTNCIYYKWSKFVVGYFQLFIDTKDDRLYEKSNDCSKCDMIFKDMFDKRSLIPKLEVSHLGRDSINWYGRKEVGFDWNVKPTQLKTESPLLYTKVLRKLRKNKIFFPKL